MKNKEILANAREGVNTYLPYMTNPVYEQFNSEPRSLADIKRIVDLEEELCRLRLLLDESYKRESYQSEEITELRREKFKRFNEEEYWIYQEGEDNYAESLVCPVTMSADQFRGFIGNTFSEAHNLEQQAKGIEDAVESASKAYEGKHLGWHAQASLICNLVSCFANQLRNQAKELNDER